jgi:hypothetical protein
VVELEFSDIGVRRGGHSRVFYRPIGISAPWKFTAHKTEANKVRVQEQPRGKR